MELKFFKMHGLGNDFMLVDGRGLSMTAEQFDVVKYADRRWGIGFDQLIWLNREDGQWHYRFFNADGSEAEQCGNGQRAIALYLHDFIKDVAWPQTVHGVGGAVRLNFFCSNRIEAVLPVATQVTRVEDGFFVDLGNPHLLFQVDDVEGENLNDWYRQKALKRYPHGVNLELFQICPEARLKLRIYERGVGETLACGSGACAAALVATSQLHLPQTVEVEMPGGLLKVCFYGQEVAMTGAARLVYQGVVNL